MNPPIEVSIVQTEQECWYLGSSVVLDIRSDVPKEVLKSWKRVDGSYYCLRKTSDDEDSSVRSGDSTKGRIHHGPASAAVWKLSDVFIKVKSWRPGMQLESNSIHFVNEVSSIPTAEVIYSWIDTEWNRTFLILKTVEGQTLDEAWDSLPSDRRAHLANTIAQYCKTLALSTSDVLQTLDGNSLVEPFLRKPVPWSEPSWKPQLLGPFSHSQLEDYLSDTQAIGNPTEPFFLYHADLGPTNIVVSEDGEIAAVIDWESFGFYPRFWVGTKPLVSAGFYLSRKQDRADRRAWATLLATALKDVGFAPDMERYSAWKKAIEMENVKAQP